LTLAIVDDIGAIVVIALFYSTSIDWSWLLAAAATVLAVFVFRQTGFSASALFAALGIVLWIAIHASGIHATIAGVIMGLLAPATPALDREIVRSRADDLLDVFSPEAARQTTRIARQAVSQLEWIEHELHGWSSLFIVPLFALANAGVELSSDRLRDAATSPVTLGVVLGLVVGKTAGIAAAAWVAVRSGVAELPADVTWRQLIGAAALGGIGFTVSLFITALAFDDAVLVDRSKMGVLAGSLLATALATALLRSRSRSPDGGR
jgi:NhaA family Na+:H+ antiporter